MFHDATGPFFSFFIKKRNTNLGKKEKKKKIDEFRIISMQL